MHEKKCLRVFYKEYLIIDTILTTNLKDPIYKNKKTMFQNNLHILLIVILLVYRTIIFIPLIEIT